MPPVVGSAPLEFNVTFIPYIKVVYYDSHASGSNDGTSWTDAYTSLRTAVNDAAGSSYVGEVRVKQGLHLINNANYAQFKNVRIIGGYTGSGGARSTDRRLTVFTGDANGDDAFIDQNSSTVGKVYDNGSFITFRAPTAEEVYWELANYSDDFYYFLGKDDTVACTNSLLECVTLTGFYHTQYKAVTSGKYNSVTITNCDFVGCHNTYALAQGDVELGAEADVLDCGFYGHTGAVLYFNGQANSDIFRVKGCKFLYSGRNSGPGRVTTVLNSNKGSVIAEDCEFGHILCENYLESGTANSNCSGPLLVAFSYYDRPTVPPVMRNCSIHNIRSPRNDKTAPLVNMAYSPGGTVENCVFEDCFLGEEYSNAKTYKNTATTFLEASTVTNCTFKNCSFIYSGDAANVIANFMIVTNGVWDTTFENCRLETSMNYPSTFVLTRNNGPVAGSCVFKNCSVTNTGTYANAAYGVAMLIGGRAINYNSSPLKELGPVAITGCEVYVPNMNDAVLVDDIGSVTTVNGASIVGNKVQGGTAIAAVVRAAGGTFVNATVANNVISDYGASAVAATVYRPSTVLSVGWSTFAGNAAPYEFYVVGNYKLTLTSSVVWSGMSGWTAYGSSTAASVNNGVAFANSYMKDVDSESAYFSGENAYTATPVFAAKLKKWDDGRLFACHSTGSPYAKGHAALAGIYSPDVALDACGAERPAANVVIGAVQQAVPGGFMIRIR